MIPVNTRGELAPVTTPAPGQPTANPALAVAIAPQMQNINMPDDPRGTKRRREEESPEAGEPVLKAARVDSDEDSEDDNSTNTLFYDLEELYLQIRDGNAAMVAEILKRSLQLLDAQFHVDGGWTPLCEAANTGRLDMVHLLVSLGSSINAHAECGLTPLMLASKKGDAEMISALCRLGADPLQIDPSTGWDALTYAISYKHLEACKSLIFNGAKITSLLKLPDAPDTHDTYFTPALVAIKADFVELIEWCIDRGDLLPNTYVGNNQTTLLGFAAAEGVVSVVKSLVRRGVMPDGSHARRPDHGFYTVWELAEVFFQPAVIECLVSEGHRIYEGWPTTYSVYRILQHCKLIDLYINLTKQVTMATPADRLTDSQLRENPEKAIEGLAARYFLAGVSNLNFVTDWWCGQGFLATPLAIQTPIDRFLASAQVLGQNTFYPERFLSGFGATQAQQLQMLVELLSDSLCAPEWRQSFSDLKLTPSTESVMNQIAIAQGELLLKGIARLRKRFEEQVATLPEICVGRHITLSHQLNEPGLYLWMTREWGLYDPVARAVLRLVKEAYGKLREVRPEKMPAEFAAMSLDEQLRRVMVDMLEDWDKIPEITETFRKFENSEQLEIAQDLLFQQWRLFCEVFGVTKPRFSQFGPHRLAQPEPEPVMEVDMPEVVTTLDGMANSSSATAFH